MRAHEFIIESDHLIIEANADEVIPTLQQLGYNNLIKLSNSRIKVLVNRKDRETAATSILAKLPGAEISDDKKVVKYDGVRLDVKPIEAQHGGRDPERQQTDAIGKLIQSNMPAGKTELPLTVGSTLVMAAGTEKVVEGRKADVAIVNASGQQVAWISLKHGPGPKSIPHWGGITQRPLSTHPEVQQFINDVKAAFPNGLPRGSTYGRPIEDVNLKLQAVFGKGYGSSDFSDSNVNLVLQGSPSVSKGKSGLVLTGDAEWANGNLPDGIYDPILMVRFAPDRSNFGIAGARFMIAPNGSRLWKQLP